MRKKAKDAEKEFWAYEAPALDEKGVRVWDWELPEKGSGFCVYPVFDSHTIAESLRMNESRILEAMGQRYLHQLHSTSGTLLPSRVWKCSSLFFAFWNLSVP